MITDDAPPPTDEGDESAGDAPADPRRWITLTIILTSVVIAALDSTVLNVAIPTILREFHTTLPTLQWVITGYSLTFAALLIIGGRLGDIFGARRMFIVGAALFGVGSLIASLSTGVPMLVVGEAVIEGMGASLMLPATMGILSSTFVGRERATAFAMWGAVMGAAVAFGPLLGGFLTTNYSWRWAFRINVIVVPFAILGAVLVMRDIPRSGRRERIDVPGAFLIAGGMFLLIYGISEGGTYGWTSVRIVGAFVVSAVLLVAFWALERRKERERSDPLFEFSNLERPAFRYGIITLMLLAMGQVAFLFVLSVVLQDGRHLSAVDTGLWLVPPGVFIVVGSQFGGRLTRVFGTTNVVRCGLVLQAAGLAAIAAAVSPAMTFQGLLAGFGLFGVGIGFAGSQLNNVILSGIPPDRAGAASGANTTVRMIGAALGIAVISSLLSSQTISHAIDAVRQAPGLPDPVRRAAVAQIHAAGVNFAPSGPLRHHAAALREVIDSAVATGARAPLIYATVVVAFGAALSWRIPQVGPLGSRQAGARELAVEESTLMAEAVTAQ